MCMAVPGVQRVLDNWTGNSFTQILTRAGYVVFQLDNRGSASRGTAFQAPIHDRLGEIEVADQVQGARWLGSQTYVDRARIGVWGWSYGGYISLMLMFKAPEVFRAGVAGAPVTDWSLYDTHYTERYLERPSDNAAGYEASSALPYARICAASSSSITGWPTTTCCFFTARSCFASFRTSASPSTSWSTRARSTACYASTTAATPIATILRFFDENLRP